MDEIEYAETTCDFFMATAPRAAAVRSEPLVNSRVDGQLGDDEPSRILLGDVDNLGAALCNRAL